jgi:hypothetical protein
MTLRHYFPFLLVVFVSSAWPLQAEEKNPETPPPAPIHLTLSKESAERGLLLEISDPIPDTAAGKEYVIKCFVTNTLQESLFMQTEPIEGYILAYNDSQLGIGVGGMWPTHSARYALLQGSRYHDDKRRSDCCSQCVKEVKIDLPSHLKPGDRVRVTFPVSGYFLQSGKPFKNSIEITLRIVKAPRQHSE